MPSFKILLAVSILFLVFSMHCQAKSHLESLSPHLQQDLQLIKRLANNPRLFNAKYLDCYLGPQASATSSLTKSSGLTVEVFRTFWQHQTDNSTPYKLQYSQPGPNNYLAEFQVLLTREEDLLIQDINKVLDRDGTPTLDQEGHATLMYLFDPPLDDEAAAYYQQWPDDLKVQHTKVLVYQDTHVVNVAKILVQYSGPPLLPPSDTDMQEAISYRRGNALNQHKLGQHDQAQRLLNSHLKTNPDDAEAHFKLAESYKAKACINESIAEYKAALSKSGDDSDLRDKCIAGLHSLKVDIPQENLPPSSASPTLLPKSPPTTINSAPRERINITPTNTSIPTSSPTKSLDVGF